MLDEIEVIITEDEISLDLTDTIVVSPYHHDMIGLDYESSGHTGFASSEQLNTLNNEVVKKQLSILPDTDLTRDRSRMSIYIDDDGTPTKASLSAILSKIIRTSETQPADMEVGEYLIKVKGD